MQRLRMRIAGLLMMVLFSALVHGADVERLTHYYEPTEWRLFPIPLNPYSPSFRAEFAVPVPAYLSIEVHAADSSGTLVRRLLESAARYPARPAVYAIDWSCTCDSLGLPASTAMHRIVVKAYSDSARSQALFADSMIVFGAPDTWKRVVPETGAVTISILKDYLVTPDGVIDTTSVHCSFAQITFVEGRLGMGVWGADANVLLVSFRDTSSWRDRSSFLWSPDGYYCRRDSSAASGYRIIRKARCYSGQQETWPLSLDPDELLLLTSSGYYPVVVDGSHLIAALRTSGAFEQ